MANPALIEGRTGTLPDGTRVIVRGGKLTTLDASGAAAVAPVMVDTKTDQDAIQANRDKGAQYIDAATKAQTFVGLNEKQGTGGALAIPFVPGMVGAFNPTVARMTSITAGLGPKQRVPGSGSSSDKDTNLYLKSVPNVDFPGNANRAIANDIQTDSNKQSAKTAFLETWFAKKGSLLGADQAFSGWWSREGAAKYDMNRRPVRPRANPAANAPKKPQGGYEILSVED